VTSRRTFLQLTGATLASSIVPLPASSAQAAYPTRPITGVVGFAAGSAIDVIARIVADQLSVQLGQQFIIDNRGGAGGLIAANLVAAAAPDGYTLLIHSCGHSLTPLIHPDARFDTATAFSGIGSFGSVPTITVISPSKGVKTLQQLVTYCKTETRSFASAGVGSASHWAVERLMASAGFHATHVPFKGSPEAMREVAAGRVDFMSFGLPSVRPFIVEGRFLALATSTPKRTAALPDVPTTLECGYPDSDFVFWNGLLAPAKTPRTIIDYLYKELEKALNMPSVKEKFAPLGNEPMPMTSTEFDTMIHKEIKDNLALAKKAGLKFD